MVVRQDLSDGDFGAVRGVGSKQYFDLVCVRCHTKIGEALDTDHMRKMVKNISDRLWCERHWNGH